ncbi:MAG TPA: reverse transcriptase family protein [Gemmatales bacterium]|nr:reverse transcriptase family protein [Gemmatales bacterium]
MAFLDEVAWFFRRVLPKKWFTYPEPRWHKSELLSRIGLKNLEIVKNREIFGFKIPVKGPGQLRISYWWHRVTKKDGSIRHLHSPHPKVRAVQRLLLRKVFAQLRVHPAVKGFRCSESVVTHARLHANKAVVIRIDIKDFFDQTRRCRVYDFFRFIGWDHQAAELMTTLCTWKDSLPQGAPTSPILSNLVNYRMDARLAGLAARSKAVYSRYADDIIFSFDEDNRRFIRGVIRRVVRILNEFGYQMNRGKLRVMRQHNRQLITGLVVNEKVQLPRKTRRLLRAIEHHLKTGKPSTLTYEQLAGWKAYQHMIQQQSNRPHGVP